MESIWQKSVELPTFPKLNGDISTDVLIIGGGITGILTAYFLKQNGVDCILADKRKICQGTTGHTTAKITYQHGLIYHTRLVIACFCLQSSCMKILLSILRLFMMINRICQKSVRNCHLLQMFQLCRKVRGIHC